MKTKEELIDELKHETSIGCTLYLRGSDGDFPEEEYGATDAMIVFEDTNMWSEGREYNEQTINEVFDATIEQIVVELGRLSMTHYVTGFNFDSTSRIYLSRSTDYSTNIDAELIDEIISLVNRERKYRIEYVRAEETKKMNTDNPLNFNTNPEPYWTEDKTTMKYDEVIPKSAEWYSQSYEFTIDWLKSICEEQRKPKSR